MITAQQLRAGFAIRRLDLRCMRYMDRAKPKGA